MPIVTIKVNARALIPGIGGTVFHGMAIDNQLPKNFWNLNQFVIGRTRSLSFSKTFRLQLNPGFHTVAYGVSSDFPWLAQIFVNGRLIVQGNVNNQNFLVGFFNVESPPEGGVGGGVGGEEQGRVNKNIVLFGLATVVFVGLYLLSRGR